LIKSEIEVKETVTKTYYLVLLAENTKKNLESNLENLKKILFETGELFKAGFAEDTDVDQVQLTITDLTNSIKSVNRQISVTRKLLKFQMGINLDEKIELSENLENILNKINSADILAEEFNIINHIDYRILETREKSLFFLLKKEKSEFLPTLSAFITYQGNAMRNEFNFFKKTGDKWFPATIIGINIAVPIFSSGSRAAKIRQAKLELIKAKNDKKNVKKGLKLDLLQARYDFSSALEKSGNTEKNVLLAKKIYAKTLVKYRQGISSSLELTQTHNQYLQSQAKHTNAVVELLNSKVKLDKALNKL
jgi:outer membrane protein TolC